MPIRVLLLHRSIGAGPIRLAQALELALGELDPNAVVKNVNILDLEYAGRFRRTAQRALAHIERMPHKVAYVYEQLDRPENERQFSLIDRLRFRRNHLRRLRSQKLLLKSFLPFLQSEPWDVIVNTETYACGLIASLKRQGKLRTPNFLITTDFFMHRSHVNSCDHYFTATEEGAAHLKALGVKGRRISVTGTPIHPDFSKMKARADCLRSQGLIGDRPIVLFIAAGFGAGATTMPGAEKVFPAILAAKTPLEIVVVAGNNQQLKTQLEQIPVPAQHRVKIFGFVAPIDELMRAADAVISKPGGMVSAEVLACGAAMVIVNPRPGLEMQNSDFLLENGVAIKNQHLETLPFQLAQLLNDAERLALMRSNALRVARPQAAFDAASKILQWVQAVKGDDDKAECEALASQN